MSETSHRIAWCARRWSDDGVAHDEQGEEIVEADGEAAAHERARDHLYARFDWPRRPLLLALTASLDGATHCVADYPANLPPADTLRGLVLGGASPVALAARLRAEATPLAVMIAFGHAFELELDALAGLATGAAAEAVGAVDLAVAARRATWERPYRLRQARYDGTSLVAVLHQQAGAGATVAELARALHEAFGLDGGDCARVLELAAERDPRFDAAFDAAVARARGRT